MMGSQSMHTVIDPVFRSKMPLLDGSRATTGLSKPQNMSGVLGKPMLHYSGAYFPFDPRGKDGAGFTPPWSNSNISLLDGRSPVSHLSGMEGQNRIIYRQDSSSSEDGHSHSSSRHHAPVKQGFTAYTKSPGLSSPTSAASVAKQKAGGENSSPPSENSVYLAIPKPVYMRNPCCNEPGCVMGQQYSVERGSLGMPNTVYEHDWMQTDAHYTERSPIQRKPQGTLRGLQFEPSAEPLKRMSVETNGPGRAKAFSTMIDPNYSSYPCTPTRTLFNSPSEQSQRLQTSPRGYPSLYPSHPTYEHMTSEVYQEHSPMSKYGLLAQHPMFYYSQANVEVENQTQCKQREDVPVILKHSISNPREHYIVPQSIHGEIPLPGAEMLPNHAFMRGYDYPCYTVPRFHLNASQIRAPLKRQQSFHSNRITVSPSSQYMEHPTASAANPHKDKPNGSLHVDKSHTNSPLLHLDQTSPTRRVSQTGVSPSNIQINRYFPPLSSLHIDQPVFPPTSLNIDRILDYSSCEDQVACPKQPKSLPVSPAAWLPRSPNHSSGRIHAAVPSSANVCKIIYSPAVAPGNKHTGPVSSSGPTTVLRGCLKRSISHSSSPIKIKEEDRDFCEVEVIKKRQRVGMESVEVGNKNDSPPMPVIDNVFSLAPYRAYLQTSGVLFPGRVPQRTIQPSEHHDVKTKPEIREKKPDRDEQQSVVCLVPPKKRADIPTEKPVVEIYEPQNIKVEKVDTDNSRATPVSHRDRSNVEIKKELEETGSSNSEPMLVIKKYEPDELESKPSLADENKTAHESKPDEVSAQRNSPSGGDTGTLPKQVVSLQPKSITPPQPCEIKLNFKNIPLDCLKLCNVILREPRHICPAPPPENPPPAQQITEPAPNLEVQKPVRKHFFELHQSLCKLVSNLVSASPEQELRTWLSQLELTDPASPSTKVPKVSCLLGVKAREAWLNGEMKSALNQVLERLREYTAQERCPFPHVMRTRAVFLPMLVVKEILFPMVQGSFIDQVLQEHRVELRPTTLSEEKLLIQLHKRACSSRLRRLMSLKHLPDIYVDVVNLLYYACVCKHLGLDMDDPADREKDKDCEETTSCRTPVFSDITASQASESHPQRHPKDEENKSDVNRNRAKSRVKTSSRRLFLDNSLSDEEEADDTEKTGSGGLLDAFSERTLNDHQSDGTENRGSDCVVSEQDPSLVPLSITSQNSWMCPLTLDKLSPSPTDTETEEYSSLPPVEAKTPDRSKSCSGVILKLRRMFSGGLKRKKACYQAISDSGTCADPSFPKTDDGDGGVSSKRDLHRRTPKVSHRWQRTGGFSHTLRPLNNSSKRKHKSLLKIKYCPYLSACHSAEHRRRWVLRSAVQRAQRAMRFYPDLVGKRIRHLYEEDDKSEVWYRGEVVRIHEASANPLNTIFEVRYDSEPEWKYYLELLIDYKKGWLKIDD